MRLETPRLILRPPEPADADAVFAGIADWDVVKMLARPPWPYRREDAAAWLEIQAGLQRAGEAHAFVIEQRTAPGACIGAIGLERNAEGEHELGFWLARPYWGRGLTTEAARAVLRAGFADPRLARVVSGCLTENGASRRIHQKLGFREVARRPLYSTPRGCEVPRIVFMLDRADWLRTGAGPNRPRRSGSGGASMALAGLDAGAPPPFAPGAALARDPDHPVRLGP